MRIVDVGSGPPVVVVPGAQGRWEWMKPGIDALAERCRVITFSLADEPTCGGRFDAADGFSCYVDQVVSAMETAGLHQATVCGVSYGGLVAAAFAARYPERVSSLVLVSAIPPSWKPDARVRFFVGAPRLLSPLFLLAALRLYPEIAAASPGFATSVAMAARIGVRALTNMCSPARMARRVRLVQDVASGARAEAVFGKLERLQVPTLIVTGEPGVDRIVPVRLTREYLNIWPHARVATITRTGHLGLVTRSGEFARFVNDFVHESGHVDAQRRRIG